MVSGWGEVHIVRYRAPYSAKIRGTMQTERKCKDEKFLESIGIEAL